MLFMSPIKSAARKSKPNWYMVATADRMILPELKRKMAKRVNTKLIEVS